ncbi:MAG: hypothetical protein LR017_00855 [Candidatus Pacebacteria bacterium]|jgi:hypothetical protein|nr:hypothetical protein [Candidatus Paceibacterota bacterium]
MGHFVHDSVQKQGLHWLSPFVWSHWSLSDGTLRRVPDEGVLAFYTRQKKHNTGAGSLDEIVSRTTTVSNGQLVASCCALLLLGVTIIW